MIIRVVSYNILVPKLAEKPGVYHLCDPRFLDRKYRLNLVEKMLEKEIRSHQNTVICLQEISRTTLPRLKLFFHRLNYVFLFKLYGQSDNDYLGIGIAIPTSMKLTDISFIHIGDEIRSQLYDKQSGTFKLINFFGKSIFKQDQKNSYDPWEVAMSKPNVLICLQVIVDGRPMCIGTYHMPMLFVMPDVMMIHASFVKDIILKLAAGKNVILAGDFNTKPTDKYYRVITERGFIHGRLPNSRNYNVSYRPNANQVFKSAYKDKNGVEPNYTNFATTLNLPTFCDTLDYIFFNGRFVVENVLKLPNHPKGISYPDATHPSDHLMIAATFRFL